MPLPKPCPKILFLLIIFFIPYLSFSQSDKEGFFWRISGNGLLKPSYLLGTVHLSDKRVFNFGDSLYAAIQESQGYAMELDPDSLMMYFFDEESKREFSPLVKDLVDPKKFALARKKLQQAFGKPADKVTIKELKGYFNDWVNVMSEGSMQTFMDAYLFNAAKKQGKWVGGIEDVADQVGLFSVEDEKDTRISVEYQLHDFMNGNKQSKKYLEDMIRIYVENDLNQLFNMDAYTLSVSKDSVMLRRNAKMSRRIDSLARIRNTVFAVGSLHLPWGFRTGKSFAWTGIYPLTS